MMTKGRAAHAELAAAAMPIPPPKKMIIVTIAATTEITGNASSDLSAFTTAQLCFESCHPRLNRFMACKLLPWQHGT
uniref:Unannotated protein n=1 Tax=freshwater metagenome TaxID=449393 RepID=A0A6J5ZXQ9_9ZZZZ